MASIAVGSVFGLRAISKNNDATDGTCKSGVCQQKSDYQSSQDANKAAVLSNVFFGVGGVALATGVVMYLLSPSHAEHAQIVPYATSSSFGLSVGGKL